MKRIIIITAVALLSVLPLTGCITDDSSSNAITPLSTELENLKTTVTTHTTKIAKLEEDVARKADSSRVDNLVTSIGQPASVDAYTRAEVDAKIAALQAEIAAIKTSDVNNPANPATGGIVVSIDKTQLYSTSNETGNKDVSATVKNNSGSGKNITLYLSLTPLSPIEDDEIEIYKAKSTLTGFNTFVEGTKQHMLDVDNLTTKIVWIVPSFYLDNGAEKPIWLQFDVKTKTMVTWTIGLKAVDL